MFVTYAMGKKIYYTFFTLILFFLQAPFLSSSAQDLQKTITGKVVDGKTNSSLEFASISVLNAIDSTLITGKYTDNNGKFSLSFTGEDSVLIQVAYLGYTSRILPVHFPEGHAEVHLNSISLNPFSNTLKTVTVEAEKAPMYEFKKDSIVFNVPEDFLTGATAMDVLEYTPTLTLDADNNIMVKGQGNVQVYVDSKPIKYTGMDVKTFLENTPSFMIEKIEILKTPPDPEDAAKALAAGVTNRYYLNIITRKIRYRGYSTALTGGANTRKELMGRLRFNMNLNPFQLNYFNNLRNSTDSSYLHRTSFIGENDSSVLDQRSYRTHLGFDQFLNGSYEFKFSEKENLRLKMRTGWTQDWQNSINESLLDNPKGVANQNRIQESKSRSDGYRFSTSADYHKEYEKEGKELRASFDFSQNGHQKNNTSSGAYLINDDTLLQINDGNNRDMNLRSSLQYKNTFGSDSEHFYLLDGSLSISKRHDLNDVSRSDTTSPYNDLHKNLRLSTDYHNLSSHYSFLGLVGKRNKKFGWVAAASIAYYLEDGADYYRLSNFDNKAIVSRNALGINYSPGEDKMLTVHFNPGFESYAQHTQANDSVSYLTYRYTNFIPGASAKYSFGDHEISFHYDRDVDRPEWDQLNPYVDNTDPLNIRTGNPELRPAFTNEYELRYEYNHKSVYGSMELEKQISKDEISRYRTVDSNGVSTRTYVNLNERQTLNAEMNIGVHYFKNLPGWKGNLNINANGGLSAYQMNSNDEHVSKDFRHVSGISGSFKLWTALRIGAVSFMVNGRYYGPRYFSQGKRPSRFSSGFRARADFFKRTLNITLGIENLFGASTQDAFYKTDRYIQYSSNRQNVRYFSLYITYKFRKYNKLGEDHSRDSQSSYRRR